MTQTAKAQEPSMEEILASIRRIIAEDEKPGEPAAPAAPAPAAREAVKEDVLELTEMVADDGEVRHVAPAEATPLAPTGPAPTVPAPTGPEPLLPDGRIEPEPPMATVAAGNPIIAEPHAPRTEGPGLAAEFDGRRLLSNAPSGAAAAAFARLATMPRERRQIGDIPLGAGDRTLEDIVRDALRPLLQAWLDDNLPDLVERLVRAEIARLVGEAGLR
jgi:hypothetical protein